MGADTVKAFTVVPQFGGYFRSVKAVRELTTEKIILLVKKDVVTVEGEKLEVGSYFEQDILIKGDIKVVKIER